MAKKAKRTRKADNIKVTWVAPDPPLSAEQLEEARQALFKLVRILARQAAREDFERERQAAVTLPQGKPVGESSKSRDWI